MNGLLKLVLFVCLFAFTFYFHERGIHCPIVKSVKDTVVIFGVPEEIANQRVQLISTPSSVVPTPFVNSIKHHPFQSSLENEVQQSHDVDEDIDHQSYKDVVSEELNEDTGVNYHDESVAENSKAEMVSNELQEENFSEELIALESNESQEIINEDTISNESQEITNEDTISNESQEITNEDTISNESQEITNEESNISSEITSAASSIEERKRKRYQLTKQRRQIKQNQRNAKKKLRTDGYYVVHPTFTRLVDTTPALPQENVTKPYSLVLFTTADVSKNYYTYKIANCLRMFNLFQRTFNFKGIVFTHSKYIVQLAKNESISYVTSFPLNPYGLPIVRDMFVKAQEMFESDYYGYINSDILLSFNIFEVLEMCKQNALKGNISFRHEIAGRVHEVKLYKALTNKSLKTYLDFLRDASKQMKPLRHFHSADYFIFSRYFDFSTFDPVVIGRTKVDNYLLSIPHDYPVSEEDKKYMVGTLKDKFVSKGHLIDATNIVVGIHLGLDGYLQRVRKDHVVAADIEWNRQFMRNIKYSFGSLIYAHHHFAFNSECLKYRYLTNLEKKREKLRV